MVTRRGLRCSRPAAEGGLGFCWQHVPVDSPTKRERWKGRLEKIALLFSATEVVIKIGELAAHYLHEFFGAGDPGQNKARHRLESLLFDDPLYPNLPDVYDPGARVDWKALEEFVREAVYIRDHPSKADPRALPWLEDKFDAWYGSLAAYHRTILLDKIEELSDSPAVRESDA